MNVERSENLKKLLEAVPAGYLVDAKWLTNQRIAYESFRDYVKRGWLERLERGVFRRPLPQAAQRNTIDWKICLLSIQHIMGYEIHVGGSTALGLQGHAHYLSLDTTGTIWIYGKGIPNWLHKLPLDAKLATRRLSLFADPTLGLTSADARDDGLPDLPWNWSLHMSGPERAIFEALDELPTRESFHNLDMIFEGTTTLRPKLLTALLHSCKKIKVKRLFFVFADRHGHAWRRRLDPEDYNLGSGDRALIKGGKIHPRYRIMVPPEFATTRATGNGT